MFDSVGFHVGQSVNIGSRPEQHIKEAEKTGRSLWKQNAEISVRIPVPGSKAALDKMEQYVLEAIRDACETLYNVPTRLAAPPSVMNCSPSSRN